MVPEGSRITEAPKTAQEDPKTALREAQERDREPRIPAFRPERPPGGPKRPPRSLKRPPETPKKPKKDPRGPQESKKKTLPPRGRRCGVRLRIKCVRYGEEVRRTFSQAPRIEIIRSHFVALPGMVESRLVRRRFVGARCPKTGHARGRTGDALQLKNN
eukprot:9503425-Pyramimonas_sp.AAC.2